MSKTGSSIILSTSALGSGPSPSLRSFETSHSARGSTTSPALVERMATLMQANRPTALAKLDLDDAEVFVKLESQGLVGSVKDRPALWVLQQAIARGDVGPTTTIIESSSGNYAMALAA
jgi:threonine synthase